MASLQLALVCATLIVSTVASKLHEPACSRYHFQEMVLEKLVRIEHQVELMDLRIERQVQLMDEKLKQFETRIEKGLGDVKQQQEALDNTKSSIIEKTEEVLSQVEANVSQTIGDAQRQVERMSGDILEDRKNITDVFQKFMESTTAVVKQMKDDVVTPAVSFFARDVADHSPSSSSLVRFTDPAVNDGDGYDASTGYFTAPYDGTYLFTVQICTYYKKYIDVQIMAAGSAVAGLRHYNAFGSHGVCTSGNAMAVLKTGDQAWVKCSSSGGGTVIYNGGTSYTPSFSGVLLHQN